MKKHCLAIIGIIAATITNAQNIGIGTTTPDPSAVVQVSSTTQGLLPPRMTTTQRTAIVNPATGLLVYQTDGTPGLYYYNGTGWTNLPGTMVIGRSTYGWTSTLAGFWGSNSQGVGAQVAFGTAFGCASDRSGNFYVSSYGNYIARINACGAVTILAGNPNAPASDADGQGSAAGIFQPSGVATDLSGNVYVVERFTNKIRKITPGGLVTTLAGGGALGDAGHVDGPAATALFNSPRSVAVDLAGNVYVADLGNYCIRKIGTDKMVTTFAGSGTSGTSDGTGTGATFGIPAAVATDHQGNVYVGDGTLIRKITPGGVVTTLANVDPRGGVEYLVVDDSGNIFFNNATDRIFKLSPDGAITTIIGQVGAGPQLADGPATQASCFEPFQMTFGPNGNLYFSSFDGFRKILLH